MVTVRKPTIPAENVTLDKTSLELTEGETAVLTATIYPENATEKIVSWTTSNAEVATVENGTVTAVAVGTAEIIVVTANGQTASCAVTVKATNMDGDIENIEEKPWN